MNGNTDKVVGNVKETAGKVTDNSELEAKGKAQKMAGNVKDAGGNAVDHVKDAADDLLDHGDRTHTDEVKVETRRS